MTTRLTAPYFTALLSLVSLALPASASSEPAVMRPELRLGAFEAPLLGNRAGRDMPAYVAMSQNTRFPGETVHRAPRELISNLVELPRSQWGGGEGADDWSGSLGVMAGSLFPYPEDESVDSYYLWTGVPKGSLVAGGDDIGLPKMWFSGLRTAQAPYEPTGRAGALTWESLPGMARTVRATTKAHQGTVLPDGTGVRSPVPVRFTRSMHLNHVNLFSSGGDVDASAAAVTAGTELRTPVPPQTVMNVQLLGYSLAGPWAGATTTVDFNTGRTSGPTGEWRLPFTVTVPKGKFIPERRDLPWEATPQFTIPFTAVGIPLAPDEAGPGANDVHLVANVARGADPMTYLLAIRQPDGTQQVRRLDLDVPGPHSWRIRDGRLEEISLPGTAGEVLEAVGTENEIDDQEQAPMAASVDYATGARVDPTTGRPTLVDIKVGGRRIADRYEVTRFHAPGGPVGLSAEHRQGRLVMREEPDGDALSVAAYRVGQRFLIVRLYAHSGTFRSYIYSLALDGEPERTRLEADVLLPAGANVVDRLAGPIDRPRDLLQTPVAPRLVVTGGAKDVPVEPAQNGIEVRTGVLDAGPDPGMDRIALRPSIGLPEIWEPGVQWLQWGTPADPVPTGPPGPFTSVGVYRIPPNPTGRPLPAGGPEQTRDLDGNESFAVAFGARRADGTVVRQADVKNLSLTLLLPDGTRLFTGSFSSAPWTPDDGTTWGVSLIPLGELPSTEVIVYARASYGSGLVTPEASTLPTSDWSFRIDRAPVTVTSTSGGNVVGTTEPGSTVDVTVPEASVSARGTADAVGGFSVPLDLSAVPSGDLEAIVRVVTPVPAEPERTIAGFAGGATDLVPDDERGSTAVRIQHVAGGSDPAAHRTTVDRAAAETFLASALQEGSYGGLRATRWAVEALQEPPAAALDHLRSLSAPGGYAWRPGNPASASASGLVAAALDELGATGELSLTALLRPDGLAGADDLRDTTSLEGTAMIAIGLAAQGDLASSDPWWLQRVADRLRKSVPTSPAEAYARAEALRLLGEEGASLPAGDGLDAVAYRLLLGEGMGTDLAPFQLTSGGFTQRRDGDRGEALPTALALAALD